MPFFSDKLKDIVDKSLSTLASPIAGVIVGFDHATHIASIRTTHRSGRGYQFYELPWLLGPTGVFAPDPPMGTHVVVAFRGSDSNYPYIQATYDPSYFSNTRQRNKRDLANYTPRMDRVISSEMQ